MDGWFLRYGWSSPWERVSFDAALIQREEMEGYTCNVQDVSQTSKAGGEGRWDF